MNKMPTISVVIPNYNNQIFLPACMESILSQDYPNFEVIIVDDASTDNSKNIIRDYCTKDSRVKALIRQKNGGVVNAREEGIRYATGDYISTLDSDDVYLSTSKLSDEYRVLKESEKTSLRPVVAYSKIKIISETGQSIGIPSYNLAEGDILEGILSRSVMIPRDFLLPKSLFYLVGGFNAKIPLYEDWDLKLRLAKCANFVYSGNSGIGYRQHNNGLSATHYWRHVYWLLYVFVLNFSFKEASSYARAIGPFVRKCFKLSIKGLFRKK